MNSSSSFSNNDSQNVTKFTDVTNLEDPVPNLDSSLDTIMAKVPLLSKDLPPLPTGSRRIYLMRHGETDWNKQGKIQGGGFDIPLNENGRQQAMTSALALEDIPIGVVASSHLSRAKETADLVWHRHMETVGDRRVIFEGFGEMRFGEFEGLSRKDQDEDPQLERRFKAFSKELKQDMKKSFPGGGESTEQVKTRAVTALNQVLTDFPEEKHIVIVSHGRTNKVVIAATALNDVTLYPTVKQGNTAINVMDIDNEGKWTLQALNHLEHVKDNVIIR